MTPGGIAQLLRDFGPLGFAALCLVSVTAMFWKLLQVQEQRITDLAGARDRETAALRAIIPVAEKMLVAIAVLEAKNRRRTGDVPSFPAQVAK